MKRPCTRRLPSEAHQRLPSEVNFLRGFFSGEALEILRCPLGTERFAKVNDVGGDLPSWRKFHGVKMGRPPPPHQRLQSRPKNAPRHLPLTRRRNSAYRILGIGLAKNCSSLVLFGGGGGVQYASFAFPCWMERVRASSVQGCPRGLPGLLLPVLTSFATIVALGAPSVPDVFGATPRAPPLCRFGRRPGSPLKGVPCVKF